MNPAITIVKSLALASCLALVACGGSSSSSTPPAASTSLSGTAAAGAALIGTVTVKGALGNTKSAIIEANGNYNVDVTGLTAPYRLRAQGTVGGKTYKLHSYAEEADVGGNVNITPFTDLIVANAAQQIAESFFDSTTDTSIDPVVLDAQEDALQAKLQNVLTALGVDSAINLLNSTFSADHSGLDAALDIVRVEVDSATNIATITNLIENTTITDDVLDDTDNSEALTVTDATVLTGAVTDTQAIAALFENFANAFANGLPTSAAIEDFLTDDFLENDFNKGLFLTDVTTDPTIIGLGFAGVTISELNPPVEGTKKVSFNVFFGDDIDPETESWFVVDDATLGWQLHGDQRIVDINTLSYHCNDSDGTNNLTGGCGINVSFFDEDFTNNGTSGSPIASATVAIIDGSNQSTKGLVYLGTPDFVAPGELQIYNVSGNVSTAGFYTGDFRGFGTGTNEINSSIFSPGDIVEYKLYTQDLNVTDPTNPSVATGTEVATYTTPILFEPSLTGLYPTATAATLTAMENFALGNDLTIAWTLQSGTISDEVLVEISDDQGNRFEFWDESFSGSVTSTTFSSTDLSSTEASTAGLDQNASTYNLLVRIYAADSVTGQFHSTDYRTTIDGPAAGGGTTTPPTTGGNLICGFSTPFDDLADQPSSFNSYNDFLTVLADCGGAITTTEADIIGTWVEASPDGSSETIVFNSGGTGTITSVESGQTFGPFALTWSLSNNLVTTFFEGGAFMDIIAITSQNMTFYSEASDWTPASDVSIVDPTTLDGEIWVGSYIKSM